MLTQAITETRIDRSPDDLAASRLRRSFREQARAGNALHLIDLSGLATLDTNTLGVLIAALRATREVGGAVRLVATAPDVLSVLAVTVLDHLMPVHASARDARAAFEQPSQISA
jgi:anti-sigma B factor antagonist